MAEVISIFSILGTVLGTFYLLNNKIDEKIDRLDTKIDILVTSIREDVKDFHGRLCKLEERQNHYRTKKTIVEGDDSWTS